MVYALTPIGYALTPIGYTYWRSRYRWFHLDTSHYCARENIVLETQEEIRSKKNFVQRMIYFSTTSKIETKQSTDIILSDSYDK